MANNQIWLCILQLSHLVMYFTVNTAFMHYFDNLTNALEAHILQDWTTYEQVLPISLQTFDFNSKLLEASKTLRFCLPIQAKERNYWTNVRTKIIKQVNMNSLIAT